MASEIQTVVDPALARLVAQFSPGGATSAQLERLSAGTEIVRDLGYDSVRLVELLLACGEEFSVELPLEHILAGETLSVGVLQGHLDTALGVAR